MADCGESDRKAIACDQLEAIVRRLQLAPTPQVKQECALGELSAFSYLIGNSRPLPTILQHDRGRPLRALLLGSGDARVLLSLAADNPEVELEVDMVDINAAVVARNVLFLSILSRLPPGTAPADRAATVARLWRAWVDVQLSEETHAWLIGAIDAALEDTAAGGGVGAGAGGGSAGMEFARDSDREAVRAALTFWRSMSAGGKARNAALLDRTTCMKRYADRSFHYEAVDGRVSFLLAGVKLSRGEEAAARQALAAELQAYADAGTTPSVTLKADAAGTAAGTAAGGKGAGSGGGKSAGPSKGKPAGLTTFAGVLGVRATRLNPTFFQPGTGRWSGHHSMAPHLAFTPLDTDAEREELAVLLREHGREPGALASWCARRVATLAAAWVESATARRRVRWWVGDAAALAAFELPRASFDFIDTSNLADHIGLPNVLVCCAPLLRRPQRREAASDASMSDASATASDAAAVSAAPHASGSLLRTQSLKWRRMGSGHDAFAEWLLLVTGVPAELTSAVFGVQGSLVTTAGAAMGSAQRSLLPVLLGGGDEGASRAALASHSLTHNLGKHTEVQEWRLPLEGPSRLDVLPLLQEAAAFSAGSTMTAAAAATAMTPLGPPAALLASGEDRSNSILDALDALSERCGMAVIAVEDSADGLASCTAMTLYLALADLARNRCTQPAETMTALLRRASQHMASLAVALATLHALLGPSFGFAGADEGGGAGKSGASVTIFSPPPGALQPMPMTGVLGDHLPLTPGVRVLLLESEEPVLYSAPLLAEAGSAVNNVALCRFNLRIRAMAAGVTAGGRMESMWPSVIGTPQAVHVEAQGFDGLWSVDSRTGLLRRDPAAPLASLGDGLGALGGMITMLGAMGGRTPPIRFRFHLLDAFALELAARQRGPRTEPKLGADVLVGACLQVPLMVDDRLAAAIAAGRVALVPVEVTTFMPLAAALPLHRLDREAVLAAPAVDTASAPSVPASLTPVGWCEPPREAASADGSLTLELRLLLETARGVHALVLVGAPAGDASWTVRVSVEAGGHALLLKAGSGDGAHSASLRLALCEPVNADRVSVKTSKMRRLVWLHARKDASVGARWSGMTAPADASGGAGGLDRLRPHSLPAWPAPRLKSGQLISPRGTEGLDQSVWAPGMALPPCDYDEPTGRFVTCVNAQWTLREIEACQVDRHGFARGPRTELKDSLQVIFHHALRGRRAVIPYFREAIAVASNRIMGSGLPVYTAAAAAALAADIPLIVHGVHKGTDGGPLLYLSYIDVAAMDAKGRERVQAEQRDRVQRVVEKQMRDIGQAVIDARDKTSAAPVQLGVIAAEDELPLMRGILQRNAARTDASPSLRAAWPAPWVQSFLCPDYADAHEVSRAVLELARTGAAAPTSAADESTSGAPIAPHMAEGTGGAGAGAASAGSAAAADCGRCGKAAGTGSVPAMLLRCSRCKAAWYCSAECQRAAWAAGHKVECRSVESSWVE